MEIERKFLIREIPQGINITKVREIEQGYLNIAPVVRIRKDNEKYELTYKSKGLLEREEYNLPLTREAYEHLRKKIDGRLITKTRREIPLNDELTIELDVFHGELAPLVLAEVEFPDRQTADSFVPPDWCGEDVTFDYHYHNSYMSQN